MSGDLAEIKERLEITATKMTSLRAEVREFLNESVEYRWVTPDEDIRSRLDPRRFKPSGQTLEARATRAVPTSIRMHVAGTLHEVRTCLDALACQLAVRNGETVDKVYFPISKSLKAFQDDGRKKIKKLAPDDQAKIELLRPYADANPLLYRLHQLDVRGKHIQLCAAASATGVNLGGMQMNPGVDMMIISSSVGGAAVHNMAFDGDAARMTEIGTFVTVVRGIPQAAVDRVGLRPCLTFDEEDQQGEVLPFLQEAHERVCAIVSEFG